MGSYARIPYLPLSISSLANLSAFLPPNFLPLRSAPLSLSLPLSSPLPPFLFRGIRLCGCCQNVLEILYTTASPSKRFRSHTPPCSCVVVNSYIIVVVIVVLVVVVLVVVVVSVTVVVVVLGASASVIMIFGHNTVTTLMITLMPAYRDSDDVDDKDDDDDHDKKENEDNYLCDLPIVIISLSL